MATFHDPAIAKGMILEHGFTKLVAFDLSGTEPIYRVQDKTPDAICSALDELLDAQEEGFRVEVGKAGDASEKGARATVWRKAMAWRFRAQRKEAAAVATPAPIHVHAPQPERIPTGYVSLQEHELSMKIAAMELQLKQATTCPHGMSQHERCEVCDGRDEDEEEEEKEGLATIVQLLERFMAVPKPTAPKAVPITGAAGNEDDAQVWAAICRMREEYPDQFATYKEELLKRYPKA